MPQWAHFKTQEVLNICICLGVKIIRISDFSKWNSTSNLCQITYLSICLDLSIALSVDVVFYYYIYRSVLSWSKNLKKSQNLLENKLNLIPKLKKLYERANTGQNIQKKTGLHCQPLDTTKRFPYFVHSLERKKKELFVPNNSQWQVVGRYHS